MKKKTFSYTLAKLVCKCIIYTHRGKKYPLTKKKQKPKTKKTRTVLYVCSREASMNNEGFKKLAEVILLLLSHICLLKAAITNKQELCHTATRTSVGSYT